MVYNSDPRVETLKGRAMAAEKPDIPADIAKLSFEKALAELEGIVDKLESGSAELEESIRIFERGEHLKAHCQALLAEAQGKIEKITLDADGKPAGTGPLDDD
jgi:exodeoxyribonuclease VII small subunit